MNVLREKIKAAMRVHKWTPGEGLMMTYYECFLADIIAAPADDTLRLIYSDHLEERGNPRGEFIKVQIALEAHGPRRKSYDVVDSFSFFQRKGACVVEGEPVSVGERIDLHLPYKRRRGYKADWYGVLATAVRGGSEYHGRLRTPINEFRVDAESRPWSGAALAAREAELLNHNADDWLCELAGFRTTTVPAVKYGGLAVRVSKEAGQSGCWLDFVEFRRGFVDKVATALPVFAAFGPHLVRRAPITCVAISGLIPDLEEDNRWRWYRGYDQPDHLPPPIFERLAGGQPDAGTWYFPTRLEAEKAASDAFVAWARATPDDFRSKPPDDVDAMLRGEGPVRPLGVLDAGRRRGPRSHLGRGGRL
jgi:uncharacterized protein (TIGR02996 family)